MTVRGSAVTSDGVFGDCEEKLSFVTAGSLRTFAQATENAVTVTAVQPNDKPGDIAF